MFFSPPIVLGFPGSGSCFHLFAELEPSDYTFCSVCMSVCICTCDEVSGFAYVVAIVCQVTLSFRNVEVKMGSD